MNFNTKDAKQQQTRISPKFYVGWNQAKIEDIEIYTAKNGSGKKQLKFRVYGPPITTEGFKPFNKPDGTPYSGQVGIIQTIYMNVDDEATFSNLVNRIIAPLSLASGVKDKVDAINAPDFETFVAQLKAIFVDESLPYVWMNFSGEEYERPSSPYPGYTLSFRNVAVTEEAKDKFPAGIMKKLAPKEEAPADDLPF